MSDGAVFVETLGGNVIQPSSNTAVKPKEPKLKKAAKQRQTDAADQTEKPHSRAPAIAQPPKPNSGLRSKKQQGERPLTVKADEAIRRAKPLDSADLHGSWAARRLQKEKEAGALSAFAGKRTTFDDSD